MTPSDFRTPNMTPTSPPQTERDFNNPLEPCWRAADVMPSGHLLRTGAQIYRAERVSRQTSFQNTCRLAPVQGWLSLAHPGCRRGTR